MADPLDVLAPALGLVAVAAYLVGTRRAAGWPTARAAAWTGGTAAAVLAVSGPLADRAETGFAAHAVAHLLLGMLAPLLLVLARPVTLALRALPVPAARRLSRLLRTAPLRVLTEPAGAAVLDLGGLWLLYRTGLYAASTERAWLHVLVHLHVLGAGYLLTLALVGADPLPHRRPYAHRAVVLVLALAAHDVLAKTLWAWPPAGVPADQARSAALVMYHGGDALDLTLAVLLCARWYRTTRPRRTFPEPVEGAPLAP